HGRSAHLRCATKRSPKWEDREGPKIQQPRQVGLHLVEDGGWLAPARSLLPHPGQSRLRRLGECLARLLTHASTLSFHGASSVRPASQGVGQPCTNSLARWAHRPRSRKQREDCKGVAVSLAGNRQGCR